MYFKIEWSIDTLMLTESIMYPFLKAKISAPKFIKKVSFEKFLRISFFFRDFFIS